MQTVAVKCGMSVEADIARHHAGSDALVLYGAQGATPDALEANVPKTVRGIISFGVCGGLSPLAKIGQAFICSTLVTPTGTYYADIGWRKRLFAATRFYERHWWSTSVFNTANDRAQRDALYDRTGCWIDDDETWAVAEFARKRGIPFQALRVVSDGEEDNLPPAVADALNSDGSFNLGAVISSLVTDPRQFPALFKTAENFKTSLDQLGVAAQLAGPDFQFEVP